MCRCPVVKKYYTGILRGRKYDVYSLFAFFLCFLLQIQQKAVRAADERYRNELEAHAGAIAALRQGEQAQDVSTREMVAEPVLFL